MTDSTIWFQGSMNDAVQLVNTKNCLFIVFLYDDSDTSTQLDQLFTNSKVQHSLQPHVSIKLDRRSENAQLFGQLYPIQRVPMVYLIKQGIIKDFAIETTSEQDFIDKVNQLTATITTTSNIPTTATPITTPATTTTLPTNTSSSSPTTVASTSTTTNASSIERATTESEELSSQVTNDTLDRKARLKQQMEKARAKRDEMEKENEKQRELKRRQDGKEAETTKQQLQEQQNKIYFAKIKKEKQADEEHRRKIKEQIARDREEKIMERRKQQQQQQQTSNSSSFSSLSSSQGTKNHDTCHLNIRQVDGVNIRHKFNAHDTLGHVRSWIDENRTDGDQPYKLLAQFPTRQFTAGDEERTLSNLDLLPSGTIIMKTIKNVATAYQSGSGSTATYYGGMMADYVYSAGGMVYNTLSSVGNSVTNALATVFNAVGPSIESDGHRLGGQHTQQQQQQQQQQEQQQQQSLSPSGSRQIHGINTLRNKGQVIDNDDDRKKTYNGNSVNQE
ncbi:uncharacterized protein BX664DRAFT_326451 [Halteromyces radiatus]|uniref:uncharacterized protein n=1 Tax=Halteromyces radiatus TaxID=101107 RepID=UPI00221FA263|nr:uncharacterized protein BX664DRAFT_326451 [Halteromyces radiatus]KAI8097469.1 hypothetical protein BX664DRAFT_326451 [Halteromyces radiatus]